MSSSSLRPRYRLNKRLGRGGMAEVFRAIVIGDGGFERRVAIKRMLPEATGDLAFARMFLDEARIASRLAHGNIVGVLDYGIVDGAPFQVLEFIDGVDASKLISHGRASGAPMPVELALHLCTQIGHALGHAHSARDDRGEPLGIVHRDVTPHNILVSWSGDVKLSDFGIVFATDREDRTQTGITKGKPAYMSPEQALAGRIDGRTDLFALGCVLHALVTGATPLAGEDALADFLAGGILPISATLPEDVRAIVATATARSRDQRYADAAEMTSALGVALAARIDRDPRGLLVGWLAVVRASVERAQHDVDEVEVEVEVEIAERDGAQRTFVTKPTAPIGVPTIVNAQLRSGSGTRWTLIALGSAAALGLGTAAWTLTHRASSTAVSAPDAAPPAASDAAAVVPANVAPAPMGIADAPPSVEDAPGGDAPTGRGRRVDAGVADGRRHEPAAVAASTDFGYVRVGGEEANRGVVYIDDRERDSVPMSAKQVGVGRHRLVVVLPDGTRLPALSINVTLEHTPAKPLRIKCSRTGCE